jgi:hypothetical protein
MTPEHMAQIIAENLPSPWALDMVWRQTREGAEFDLSQAESAAEEWLAMARVVINAMNQEK